MFAAERRRNRPVGDFTTPTRLLSSFYGIVGQEELKPSLFQNLAGVFCERYIFGYVSKEQFIVRRLRSLYSSIIFEIFSFLSRQ